MINHLDRLFPFALVERLEKSIERWSKGGTIKWPLVGFCEVLS